MGQRASGHAIFNLEAFWIWPLIVVQSERVIWFVSQGQVVAAVLGVLSILAGIVFSRPVGINWPRQPAMGRLQCIRQKPLRDNHCRGRLIFDY